MCEYTARGRNRSPKRRNTHVSEFDQQGMQSSVDTCTNTNLRSQTSENSILEKKKKTRKVERTKNVKEGESI